MSAALRAVYSSEFGAVSHRLLQDPWMFNVTGDAFQRPPPVLDTPSATVGPARSRNRTRRVGLHLLLQGVTANDDDVLSTALVVESFERVEAAVRRPVAVGQSLSPEVNIAGASNEFNQPRAVESRTLSQITDGRLPVGRFRPGRRRGLNSSFWLFMSAMRFGTPGSATAPVRQIAPHPTAYWNVLSLVAPVGQRNHSAP